MTKPVPNLHGDPDDFEGVALQVRRQAWRTIWSLKREIERARDPVWWEVRRTCGRVGDLDLNYCLTIPVGVRMLG